jgi:hypothetical protein
LQAGTEQAAELVAAATHGDAEAARSAPAVVRPTIQASGLPMPRSPSGDVHEPAPGAETIEPEQVATEAVPTGAEASFARMLAEVLREQAEQNAEAMAALARAEHLSDVLRLQGDYLRQTLERMANLNRRWLELAAKTWPNDQAD